MFDPQLQPGLRASDADREVTVERLRQAAMEGRLDADELDERLSAAYSARLCSELTPLTADVTPVAVPPRRRPYVRRPTVNRLALLSLVSAIMWLAWLGSLLAVVSGHIALRQIDASDGAQYGRGAAVAGLLFGYLSLLPVLLVVFGLLL